MTDGIISAQAGIQEPARTGWMPAPIGVEGRLGPA
jgi:hypothetical protein